MEISDKKKKIIGFFMQNDALISLDSIEKFEDEIFLDKIISLIDQKSEISVILDFMGKYALSDTSVNRYQQNTTENTTNQNTTDQNSQSTMTTSPTISTQSTDSSQSTTSSEHTSSLSTPAIEIQTPTLPTSEQPKLNIIHDFNLLPKKREVSHFVSYFSSRYKQILSILKNRKELSSILSIARLKAKTDREKVSVICLVRKKDITKNDNIILTVEDLTGEIKVLVNKSNKELTEVAKDLVRDEVIGVVGMNGDNILFSNSIIQPEIPLDKEFKKAEKEECAVFLSDIHVGSKYFLADEFNKFISWIRQETGTENQRKIADKVKYVFIAGDLVDGVGIYPNQELELDIDDIYGQYSKAAELIKKIPSHISVIICPGNHDASRLSEPQPKLFGDYIKPLSDIPNVSLVSNPSYINISATETFSGFDILLYHGYSFDYYVANVDSLRLEGGYDRADLIMKFLLKRRHLAPAYTSTLFIPEETKDSLVIEKIPDFFITGHIHKTAVSNYRNVTLISGSCWQSITSFQEKVGHHPEPAKVPVVNLKTRKVTILNFLD